MDLLPDQLARLKLAALTLLEWGTPASTTDYKTIISELIKTHPYASLWGLTPDSKIFHIDRYGITISFLVETLEEFKSDDTSGSLEIKGLNPLEFSQTEEFAEFLSYLFQQLNNYCTNIGVDDKEYFFRVDIARRIVNSLGFIGSINDNQKQIGKAAFGALISLSLRDTHPGLFKHYINDLVDRTRNFPLLISKLERVLLYLFSPKTLLFTIIVAPFILTAFYWNNSENTPWYTLLFTMFVTVIFSATGAVVLINGIVMGFQSLRLKLLIMHYNNTSFKIASANLLSSWGTEDFYLLQALIENQIKSNLSDNQTNQNTESYLDINSEIATELFDSSFWYKLVSQINVDCATAILEVCSRPKIKPEQKIMIIKWLFSVKLVDH